MAPPERKLATQQHDLSLIPRTHRVEEIENRKKTWTSNKNFHVDLHSSRRGMLNPNISFTNGWTKMWPGRVMGLPRPKRK